MSSSSRFRILVVKRDKIGDMLLTTPLLAQLRRGFPDAALDVLATDYNAWVVADDRSIDRCYALPRIRVGHTLRLQLIPRNAAERLRLARNLYDFVIVAQGEESPRAIRRALAVRAKRVVAYAAGLRAYGRGLTDPVRMPPEDMHEVDRMLALVRALDLAAPPHPPDPVYTPPPSARAFAEGWLRSRALAPDGFVVLGLGARRAARQPSAGQIARWTAWWRERYGLATVFVWTPGGSDNPVYPGDDDIAEPVVKLRLPGLHPFRGSIHDTLALIWHARTSVFPDSGLMQFAAASPGGVLGLFAGHGLGPPPERWSPRGARARWLQAEREVPGLPDELVTAKLEALVAAGRAPARERVAST